MAQTTTQSGRRGEAIAERYYLSQGFKIIARNYSVRGGEIDLVAYKHGEIVFVEVKARSSDRFGRPSEAVDDRKIAHLHRAQRMFLYDNMHSGRIEVWSPILSRGVMRRIKRITCDIAEVYFDGEDGRVNIIKNAFEAAEI